MRDWIARQIFFRTPSSWPYNKACSLYLTLGIYPWFTREISGDGLCKESPFSCGRRIKFQRAFYVFQTLIHETLVDCYCHRPHCPTTSMFLYCHDHKCFREAGQALPQLCTSFSWLDQNLWACPSDWEWRIAGGCKHFCSELSTQLEATVCDLLRDVVSSSEFSKLVEDEEPDPI